MYKNIYKKIGILNFIFIFLFLGVPVKAITEINYTEESKTMIITGAYENEVSTAIDYELSNNPYSENAEKLIITGISMNYNDFIKIKERLGKGRTFEIDISGITNLLKIPEGGTSGGVLQGLTKLEKVVLGNGLATIAKNTFKYCTLLKEINLEAVKTIGENAFEDCIIKTLDLSNITSIGDNAFKNCSDLLITNLNPNISSFNKTVFQGCSFRIQYMYDEDDITQTEIASSYRTYEYSETTSKDLPLKPGLENRVFTRDKTNNEFEGWYDSLEGGNKIDQIAADTIGTQIVYARWKTAVDVEEPLDISEPESVPPDDKDENSNNENSSADNGNNNEIKDENETVSTVPDSPKTGDKRNKTVLKITVLLAICYLVFVYFYIKNKKTKT
ncbi:MAG: leucine-rich repeat protein [Candidatus Paraimprobicoccus trichonymphae]|uniref:Leucine-rich repeat protein n=1 Tax=Candidatus Paraimprobicoccus trichonymphae TaxID=3033793 RepID=A0AA48I383_9FIRM|nr:MAG: leucine-rich repeat protein [Candidatus Paraimprobicoccus trichonymphae]